MNITGIITEYNPFHNGHLYHLSESRRQTDADYVIAVMSGDFLQRGVPAILNKYDRAQMALTCGADLVLELPAVYACASAEHFAFGAVSLLDALGAVTDLVFGSETANLPLLTRAADLLAEEPPAFRTALDAGLRRGLSFPRARMDALLTLLATPGNTKDILSSPNSLLALEYLKALRRRNSSITPHVLQRRGRGYHDTCFLKTDASAAEDFITSDFASATGIRLALLSGSSPESLADQLPAPVIDLLTARAGVSFPIEESDFSTMLHYQLLLTREELETYADVSSELAARIRQLLPEYSSLGAFTEHLKTKNYTRTRILRALLHILLKQRKEEAAAIRACPHPVPYARVLGFRRSSAGLLTQLSRHSRIPLITKLADADTLLHTYYGDVPAEASCACSCLSRDLFAAQVYEAAAAAKFHRPPVNEYTKGLILL